jgi:pimeloyl-ACP methyl ester carboxylesterase
MTSSFSFPPIDISYTQAGQGTPVLLLHGFGEDSSVLPSLFDVLQQHYLVVLPDLPGSGRSAFDAGICSSIDNMADAMLALMQSITKEPFVVLGHSMGGYIALAMAEKQPQALRAFGLLHSTAFADSVEKKETRRKAIQFIQANGSGAFLKTSIPGLFSEAFQQSNLAVVQALVEKGNAFLPEALCAYYKAMMERPDRTAVLANTSVPVLFVIGEFDKAAPMPDVLQQVHLPVQSHVHILRHTAHMGMFEEPERFNKCVVQFLNDIA